MKCLLIVCVSLLMVMFQPTDAVTLTPVIINSTTPPGTDGACPSQEERDDALQNITDSVQAILHEYYNSDMSNSINPINIACGEGQWHKVAYLNMSDPSQQCPSAWREYNSNGVRACGRPESESGSCPATIYSTGRQYNRVCGRVIGYQVGSTDAFALNALGQTIDSYYVYGVSITHGNPRNHIWTLAGGVTDATLSTFLGLNCPCSDPPGDRVLPPAFVGDNYYCESGISGSSFINYHLYSSDPLWDGQQCEGECCSNGKSPPWFSVELPNPTTDDIEVRICNPEGTFDDTPVQVLELYIQ